jgi:hypothetical protein
MVVIGEVVLLPTCTVEVGGLVWPGVGCPEFEEELKQPARSKPATQSIAKHSIAFEPVPAPSSLDISKTNPPNFSSANKQIC